MQKLFFRTNLTVLAILLFSLVNIEAAAIVDKTFGANGTLNVNVGTNQIIEDIGVQTDGKIVIIGSITSANGDRDIFLARYNSNGTADASFGINGISKIALTNLNEFVYDFEFQTDGKIVAVGRQQTTGETEIYDFLVIRFNTNGSLDTSFAGNGFRTINQGQNDQLNKAAIQTDGKIVVVGETGTRLELQGAIGRLNSDGSLDSKFEGVGFFIYKFDSPLTYIELGLSDVEILPDGSILIGGEADKIAPYNLEEVGFYEIKLPSNGNPDVNPGSDELSYTFDYQRSRGYQRKSYDAEVLPNGKVVRASGIGVFIGEKRFLQDGTNAVVLPNGRIAVAGERFGGNLKIYSENNLIGTAWNIPTGKLAAQPDNKVLILNDNSITRISSITSQGTRLANFNKDYLGEGSTQDDKTDFAYYRPGEKKISILKSNGEIVERTTLAEPTRIFPEFTIIGFDSIPEHFKTNFYRQVLTVWEAGNAPNGQAFFKFDRASDDDLPKVPWGLSGDIAYGGDFDGNGLFDVGVFRPSNGVWYGLTEPLVDQQGQIVQWGTAGDKPVPADYDFDGITDYAIYRPSTGTWWILKSSGGSLAVKFGLENDIPLTGDFDADGRADFTVYRPSEGIWYQLLTTEGFRGIKFGIATDIPVPGDYDGDGRHDVAVFRDGLWYLLQSTEGFKIVKWGTAGDIPIAVRYDR